MTKKKRVTFDMEMNSIFGQPRYLNKITIAGFCMTKAREDSNWKFMKSIERLVKKYNNNKGVYYARRNKTETQEKKK